jgi:hypothetical protein
MQPKALRLESEGLDMARQRVVGLVAVHVHAQAALSGNLAQGPHCGGAILHRALEMRDAADDLDAPV